MVKVLPIGLLIFPSVAMDNDGESSSHRIADIS